MLKEMNDITVEELRELMRAQKTPKNAPAEISMEKLKTVFSELVRDQKFRRALFKTGAPAA